ncbi:glycosyl transferase group 1 [Alkalidesulfovibrio alkalitolerans DSM 16529]|jgi:glycosyltransferase involved in cell wall biosynthesis|uniref:Glycosyl transferase group 1 n=1 Tax=Alkalidesulfovibrio alkalitolerans DSM 16529 TaxID=1121439 RepID=S7T1V7_9BACT|nr:glycosyltransferase [Alkalidesulfovibrio alkalitolerans]EPR30561.1 glycosyl transferase group 1 [Alkalidesulfovibrio alkalitolerans DSM 16529]
MSAPKRIAFLIDAIASPSAGTERQLLMLIEGLDRREFEPWLCVLKGSPWLSKSFDLCPVRVLDIESFKSPGAWMNVLRFSGWLRRERIDALQVHFRDSSLAGIVAARLARTPAVIAMRKNQGYWMNSAELRLQRFLNRFVDVFVANSEATRDWARRVEGILPERLRVIHNGFFGETRKAGDEAARRRARQTLDLPLDAPVAGIVANLRPVKRLDVFLRAAARVREALPSARFVIIGEGEERERLQTLVRSLGLNGEVRFTGRRMDVPDLLPAFDVGVLSSDSESFSNSVVEYMAAGLPVAATDVGGCHEALAGGAGGILVAPGDAEALGRAMVEMLSDEHRASHARAAHPRRVAEAFSRDRYLAAYAALYNELLKSTGRRASCS